jgi:hypothetical protein
MLWIMFGLVMPLPPSGVTASLFLDLLRDRPTGQLYWLAYEEKELQIRTNSVYGRVVKVTDDTITIRGSSGFERTFEVSPEVASEAIPPDSQRWSCAHRLNQVRGGDLVHVYLAPTARRNVVTALSIRRRPGVNIPRSEDMWVEAELKRFDTATDKDSKAEARCMESRRSSNLNNKRQQQEIAELYLLPSVRPRLPRFSR